ncbi:MAG: histidine kinase [Candidatus Nanopelagicales bacterium]
MNEPNHRFRYRMPRLGPTGHLVSDIVLGAVLGIYAAGEALSGAYPGDDRMAAVLLGGAGLALALRRRRPVPCFITSMGLLLVASALVGPYQTGGSILIAVTTAYSGMAYGVSWPLFSAAVLAFAVLDNRGPLPDSLGGAAFVVVLLGLVGYGGWLTRRLREVSAANEALRRLVELEADSRTAAAVDDERARVARELHDILSHSLGVVVLQTGAAEHAWDDNPASARASVAAARVTALEAVEQLRTLLAVVRDEQGTQRSPVPTLDDLVDLARRSTEAGFHVDVSTIGEPRAIAPHVQASVYRVAQEGIANAMKHSGTKSCLLELAYGPDTLTVRVDDVGTPGPSSPMGSRLGLVGVRERATLLGGTVESGPRDGGGWRLQVAFPS